MDKLESWLRKRCNEQGIRVLGDDEVAVNAIRYVKLLEWREEVLKKQLREGADALAAPGADEDTPTLLTYDHEWLERPVIVDADMLPQVSIDYLMDKAYISPDEAYCDDAHRLQRGFTQTLYGKAASMSPGPQAERKRAGFDFREHARTRVARVLKCLYDGDIEQLKSRWQIDG